MKDVKRMERRRTTLGELVAALCSAAFEVCEEEKRAYRLVALALEDLLKRPCVTLPNWRPPAPVFVPVEARSFLKPGTSIR